MTWAGPDRVGAVDVHYPGTGLGAGGARAALVVAADARFAPVIAEQVALLDAVEPYRPGQFYRRELPAIEAVLAAAAVPVIGVAKTAFATATHAVAVHRGGSLRPLYEDQVKGYFHGK